MYQIFGAPLMSAVVVMLLFCGVTGNYRRMPANCLEATILASKNAKSGIYQILLPIHDWSTRRFFVYCLCEPDCNNPWLVVQRRFNDTINFNRDWNDYKYGFGNMNTNFWLGLDKLHALTSMEHHELQIVVRDFNDTVKYANYEGFAVGNEEQKYEINMLGPYSGDAGDALSITHVGRKFSTYDQDNDYTSKRNCATEFKSGWWFGACLDSNLNGEYVNGDHKLRSGSGIMWHTFRGWQYSMKYAHMAIRPRITGMKKEN